MTNQGLQLKRAFVIDDKTLFIDNTDEWIYKKQDKKQAHSLSITYNYKTRYLCAHTAQLLSTFEQHDIKLAIPVHRVGAYSVLCLFHSVFKIPGRYTTICVYPLVYHSIFKRSFRLCRNFFYTIR